MPLDRRFTIFFIENFFLEVFSHFFLLRSHANIFLMWLVRLFFFNGLLKVGVFAN